MEFIQSVVPYFELFFLLMIGHAIADYAMQNDFVAAAKNHTTDLGKIFWKWVLPSHGLMHALPVYLITGSFLLSIAEFLCHCVIDYLKCDGRIGFNTDQFLHMGCKVVWVGAVALSLPFVL